MNYQVEDNFLSHHKFEKLHEKIMGPSFPWSFCDIVVDDEDKDRPDRSQFVYHFYHHEHGPNQGLDILQPILDKIGPRQILRIKANLQPYTCHPEYNDFHTDVGGEKDYFTSIFYLNTCDGETLFENGDVVESIANRMLTFQGHLRHTGKPAKNAKRRVLINFCYR